MHTNIMFSGTRQVSVWRISSCALLVISCVLGATFGNTAIGQSHQGKDSIRSHVRQSVGSSPLLTKWLADIIKDSTAEEREAWLEKIQENNYENEEEEKAISGIISFNSIHGYITDNKTMVRLNVKSAGTFEVSTLILAYNDGEDAAEIELDSPWTGVTQDFDFEADIFGSETINLMLTGHIEGFNSSVTAEGMVEFEFKDPEAEMTYVGSESKTSTRIAGKILDSSIDGGVHCEHYNGTACYELEKAGSFCRMVDLGESKTMSVCDSSTYIDELNEIPQEVDLMWMEMEMEMDGMNMSMPMLMATLDFGEMPTKMEVVIYADDDPSKIYSPHDHFCEIQHEDMPKMKMEGTMCHQMLPSEIPAGQGVQVLVVGLDENGTVIGSGLQWSLPREDYTAIIVGACMGAVVGVACIVALVGCYVEKKKKKKKQQDIELH